jgi:hypothetical protein
VGADGEVLWRTVDAGVKDASVTTRASRQHERRTPPAEVRREAELLA